MLKIKELNRELLNVFCAAIVKSHITGFNWVWSRGQKIYNKQQNDNNPLLKKHAIASNLRCIERNKNLLKQNCCQPLMKWLNIVWEANVHKIFITWVQQKMGGNFLPCQQFDTGQWSPLPYSVDISKTYEEI